MQLELLKERFLDKKDIWDIDFGEPRFDRDLAIAFGSKHRGSIRLAMGLFHTEAEWKQIRERSLRVPLP
jgi:hypothetical protein